MRKNKAVAELANSVGYIGLVIVFLVGVAKFADPTQYSLIAQLPSWAFGLMTLAVVICLLADWYFRPVPRKPLWRKQDFRTIKTGSGRTFF